MLRLAPLNLGSALLVLAAVLVEGTAAYLLWAAAFALEWFTPRLASTAGFRSPRLTSSSATAWW